MLCQSKSLWVFAMWSKAISHVRLVHSFGFLNYNNAVPCSAWWLIWIHGENECSDMVRILLVGLSAFEYCGNWASNQCQEKSKAGISHSAYAKCSQTQPPVALGKVPKPFNLDLDMKELIWEFCLHNHVKSHAWESSRFCQNHCYSRMYSLQWQKHEQRGFLETVWIKKCVTIKKLLDEMFGVFILWPSQSILCWWSWMRRHWKFTILAAYQPHCLWWVQIPKRSTLYCNHIELHGSGYSFLGENNIEICEFHVDYLPDELPTKYSVSKSVCAPSHKWPIIIIRQDECVFSHFLVSSKMWTGPNGGATLRPESEGESCMISAMQSHDLGFGLKILDEQLV